MYDSILVPTDGSKGTERAIKHASSFASKYDSEVHVLYVIDTSVDNLVMSRHSVEKIVKELKKEGEKVVMEASEKMEEYGVKVVEEVRRGNPYKTILDYSEENDTDMIAMGTHGRTGVGRYVLGSVAERIVRLSEVPVLTTHMLEDLSSEIPYYDDVLVPTDGSDESLKASEHAIDIASKYGAMVHALYVVNTGILTDEPLKETFWNQGEKATTRIARKAAEADVEVKKNVVEGIPHEEIVEYSESRDTDLTVMGTRGKTGLDRVLIGSVAERVVRTSPTPVLTVRKVVDN